MARLAVEQDEGGLLFTAKVVAGSSRTSICGVHAGMLKVKVAAPPEKGKANQCLLDFLAGGLGIKKSDIVIVSGEHSPIKRLKVAGVSAEVLMERLGLTGSGC